MTTQPNPTHRLLLTAPLLALLPSPALSESGAIHAELSALASKIPGAGMPDVYYPNFFLGEWLVSRKLYAVETSPDGSEPPDHSMLSRRAIDGMRERIGKRETYHIRFLNHRGKVIEERLYNTVSELKQSPERVVVTWDRDNANVLTTQWGVGGRTRETKITKRSFVDGPQGYGTFVSSEYARVVDIDGEGALVGLGRPPSIFGRRRIVSYKVSSVSDKMEPDGMDRTDRRMRRSHAMMMTETGPDGQRIGVGRRARLVYHQPAEKAEKTSEIKRPENFFLDPPVERTGLGGLNSGTVSKDEVTDACVVDFAMEDNESSSDCGCSVLSFSRANGFLFCLRE